MCFMNEFKCRDGFTIVILLGSQGSILGPLLFSLYRLPVGAIFKKYKISYHCYADDTQFYLPAKTDGSGSLDVLDDCFEEIKGWMADHFLQLSESKSEI